MHKISLKFIKISKCKFKLYIYLFLGQFLHRYISVYKQRSNKKDQIVGHLQIKEPGFDTTRMRAVLVKKPDEITAKREPCWNIHSKLKDVFDRNVQDFYIKDIMQT